MTSRDEELSRRIRAGDPAALAEAYRWHAASVYGVARRALPADPATAEDVVQDVFLRLWERPADYDPRCGRLGAWLCTVARNRAIDHLRHLEVARRRLALLAAPLAAAPLGADPLGAGPSDAAEPALRDAVRCAVRAAVEGLPEPHRTAVLLAYYRGLSYRQVAVELGVAEGTAKSRLRLGLRRLAARLAAEGII